MSPVHGLSLSETYRVCLKGRECSFVYPPVFRDTFRRLLSSSRSGDNEWLVSRFSMSIASWMALLSVIHRFKSTAKIELRFHSRVWFYRYARCTPPSSPSPAPRPPTVSLDLDLTANDPRVRPNHVLSLILVAVLQALSRCFRWMENCVVRLALTLPSCLA
jgi:hypothetical protein